MAYMTEHEAMRSCIDERDEALDTIDDIVDTIAKQIISIAHDNEDFVCSCCIRTSKTLFGLLKKYAREEDVNNIREQWESVTEMRLD